MGKLREVGRTLNSWEFSSTVRTERSSQEEIVPVRPNSAYGMSQGNKTELDWDSLLTSLYGDVFRRAFKLCRSKVLAEDLAQETFLRAWRYHHTLRDADSAKAWLFTILRNENNRRFARYRLEPQFIDEYSAADTRDREPDYRAERLLMQRAITELDATYSEPLILHVFGGYTGKEIAARLNLKNNTVMTRLFRARDKLNRKFQRKS